MKAFYTIWLVVISISLFAQTHQEILKKDLLFEKSGKGNTLIVANINGSVSVKGHSGSGVLVEGEKIFKAKSKEKLDEYKEKINVGYIFLSDTIILYVDGLCNKFGRKSGKNHRMITNEWGYHWDDCRDKEGWSRQEEIDYTINFVVMVPYATNIVVSTINNGNVKVLEIEGDVSANNVNGSITLHGLTGKVSGHTVNGDVDVDHATNPRADLKYYTLNGNINANFPPGLKANMSFQSFNGGLYTNIERLEPMPVLMEEVAFNKGIKYKINGNRYKVGGGGPALDFETFNGNVYLKEIEK